jgi:hypothetical protein
MTEKGGSSCASLFASLLNVLSVVLLLALFALQAFAQAPLETSRVLAALPEAPSSNEPAGNGVSGDNTRITVPVGTVIPLVLTRSLNSHAVNAGDAVFAQISTPVMVDDQVAIPAGTFVRGKVDRLTRSGTRGELFMRSAALVMGTAVVDIGGPVKIESEEWTAYNNPSGKSKAAIILAPLIGTGLGMGIGAATDKPHTFTIGGGLAPSSTCCGLPGPLQPVPGLTVTENSHKGLAIGAVVGGVVGGITGFAFIAHSHSFYLEEGSPLHMTLASPVSLTRAQIAEAEHSSAPVQVIRRRRPWTDPANEPPIGFPGGTPSSGPGSCSAGQEWCQGSCKSPIDFTSDDNNCGRCGNSCSIGESCTGGMCMKQP